MNKLPFEIVERDEEGTGIYSRSPRVYRRRSEDKPQPLKMTFFVIGLATFFISIGAEMASHDTWLAIIEPKVIGPHILQISGTVLATFAARAWK